LLVVSSNYVSILHVSEILSHVPTTDMTAYDFEKSFTFGKTVEITSHVRFLIYM